MILVRRGVCLWPPMACVKLEPRANDAAVLPNNAGRRRLLVARRNPKAARAPCYPSGLPARPRMKRGLRFSGQKRSITGLTHTDRQDTPLG